MQHPLDMVCKVCT